MKKVQGSNNWAHVLCANWLPEITFGDPDRKEPIVISSDLSERMKLKCCLCKEKYGAPVQCYFKKVSPRIRII